MDLINKLIEVLKINSKFESNTKNTSRGKLEIRSWYFSDSFVFLMKKKNNEKNLSQLFFIIRYLQDKFWEKGYCFRGAVALGGMYYPDKNENENILLGEGIIRAYELETKVAIYPRIVVDEKVYNFIMNNKSPCSPFGKRGTKLIDLIKKDKDGIYFLDLLNPKILRRKDEKIKCKNEYFSINWEPCGESNHEHIIRKVDKIVEKGLENDNIQIKQKYEWLKSYLNEI